MSKVPYYAELIETKDDYLLVTCVRDVPKYDALKTALEVKREQNLQHLKVTKVKTKEIIIKEQHNCKATGYWKTNSVKYNFLLIAHEYLFIFRK